VVVMKTIFLSLALSLICFGARAQCADINTGFTDSIVGATVYFTDQSSTSMGWLIYDRFWAFGDSTYDSVVLNPIHTYHQPGNYIVYLSIKGQLPQDSATALYCDETIAIPVSIVSTGMVTLNETNRVLIYPNPSNGRIRIKSFDIRIDEVLIYNMSGELLARTDQLEGEIDLPENNYLNSYFVRVKTDRGDIVKQILISR